MYIRACIYKYLYMYTCVLHIDTYACSAYVYLSNLLYTDTCMFICVYRCVYVYMYMHIRTRIHRALLCSSQPETACGLQAARSPGKISCPKTNRSGWRLGQRPPLFVRSCRACNQISKETMECISISIDMHMYMCIDISVVIYVHMYMIFIHSSLTYLNNTPDSSAESKVAWERHSRLDASELESALRAALPSRPGRPWGAQPSKVKRLKHIIHLRYYIILYYSVLYYTIFYNSKLFYIIIYYSISYYTVLY